MWKNWFCHGYEIKEVKDRQGRKWQISLKLIRDEKYRTEMGYPGRWGPGK